MLKSIETINIQSHKHILMDDLPKVGLITIEGENSYGKSIPIKCLRYVMSGKIRTEDVRRGLISWWSEEGEMILRSHDNKTLTIHLAVKASDTYVRLDDGEHVTTKTLQDGGFEDILAEFGLHYDKEKDLSLNIYSTFDPLLGVTTTPSASYASLVNCFTDPRVETSLAHLTEFKSFVEVQKKNTEAALAVSRARLDGLVTYDVEVERDYMNTFRTVREVLTTAAHIIDPIPPIDYVENPAPSTISYQSLKDLYNATLEISKVNYKEQPAIDSIVIATLSQITEPIQRVPTEKQLPSIPYQIVEALSTIASLNLIDMRDYGKRLNEAIEERVSIDKQVCPTCGRSLINVEHTIHSRLPFSG